MLIFLREMLSAPGLELELKWPFTRNISWETRGVEWQNTPRPDADGVVRVCACLNLTVVAKLSESCDNWSQMFESCCVVILATRQTLESGCQKSDKFHLQSGQTVVRLVIQSRVHLFRTACCFSRLLLFRADLARISQK